MEKIYLLSWMITGIALVSWVLFQKHKALSKFLSPIVLLAAVCWLASLFLSDAPWAIKNVWLFRDAVVMVILSIVAMSLRANKIIGLAYLILITCGGKWLWDNPGKIPTYATSEVALDQNCEYFVMTERYNSADLSKLLDGVNLRISKSFDLPSSAEYLLDDCFCVDLKKNNVNFRNHLESVLTAQSIYWEKNEQVSLDLPSVKRFKLPSTSKQHYNDPFTDKQWALDAISLTEMHNKLRDITPQKKSHLVILDTGVDADHEDLKKNYISLGKKHDRDKSGHGTHVSGIAAATTNNKTGIASACQDDLFEYSMICVLPNGFGNQKTIVEGMIKAADAGADVINMSLGGPSNPQRKKVYDEAVAYCARKGTIVVAAAGNSARDAANYSPANSDGLIAVAATDESGNLCVFSNQTDNIEMALSAPGDNIFSTMPKQDYKAMRGTSMASPYVASIIAVLKAYSPELTAYEAYEMLVGNAASTKNKKLDGSRAADRLISRKQARHVRSQNL